MPRSRQSLAAVLLAVVACFGRNDAHAASPIWTAELERSGANPYYPGPRFPKLITPRWVGEEGVEAVVVLAVDDMRDPARYETFLRPILERLKRIDGRAPVSIMTNQVNPADTRLRGWLAEGLSIDVHTLTHPCPCLQKSDLAEAERTYHGCVDLLSSIPGNQPVAFRMPCCDSINSVSPRFFAEIFNKTSPRGNFLSIDSSVFVILTPDDPSLPRDLVFDSNGRERFRKYLPFPSFVNTIENYPYPYVIGGTCWEFPCIVPSDWEAQNLHKPNNPKTLEDLKAALDAVVLKQGVFNLVFHPHNWIKNTQVVELIDHAVKTHGKKVKFLTFKEALERLNQNLLGGKPLRGPDGKARGVELVLVDKDGLIDGFSEDRTAPRAHHDGPPLPTGARQVDEKGRDGGLRFVDIDEDGHRDVVFSNDQAYGIFLFDPTTRGYTRKLMAGKAGEPGALPKIVRDGTNNGFFVHSRTLWWQNEDTAKLPDLVDRRSFNELLKNVEPTAKTPEAALRSIRVGPGFQVEQVAREPLVKDPIAFDWSADGRLWVVEMGDYPLGADGRGKPGGVVRFLEDLDGDGRYDKATTFLDGLGFPNGIMPWRKGVLISCAPDILYAEDRDGDGKADHREVLFTGFVEGNQQHRLNGFELGLDGWVYGANGDSGGTVRSLETGKVVPIRGRDFRFRPDTGEFEAESGQTQYGRHRDDWGHWFGNNNPNWGWQFMLSDQDLRRNPAYSPPSPRQNLEPDTLLFPRSRTLTRFNDPRGSNHVTSANSPTPYRDDLFGPWFETSLFVSEPVHNLVHRMVLEPRGAALEGRRGPNEASSEFLASSDNWFRPTMLKTGPDGALWVADMYRAVIEHPEWIPDDWERRLDLRAGSEQGRIYRVYPVDKKPRPIPRLDHLDTAGLVAALESPSGWQRDTAQRLLLHQGGNDAFGPLRSLIAATKEPKARVQAIWTLADLVGLDETSALAGLRDPDARVRESILPAAAALADRSATVAKSVYELTDDADARVRFRVALALGNIKDRLAGEALAKLAVRDVGDPWMQAAIFSSAALHMDTLLLTLLRGDETAKPGTGTPPGLFEPLLAMAGGMASRGTMSTIAQAITAPTSQGGSEFAGWQYRALGSLLMARERAQQADDPALDQTFAPLWKSARRVINDNAASTSERLGAMQLLGQASKDTTDRDALLKLLSPRTAVEVQQGAVAALGHSSDPRVAGLLVADWKRHSPTVRSAILDALLSRQAWTESLLSSLEDTCVPPAEIDPSRRQQLLRYRNRAIRARAQAIFEQQSQTRQSVIDAYRPALELKGDPVVGARVFQKQCASCHRMGNTGMEVGPDLTSLNDRSPQTLLIAILDPNRAFEARYTNFTVATKDGRVLSGLIASESSSAVTLRRQEGKEEVLLRSQIDEMHASGQSLMPEGLEKDLKPRDLADLFAYLSTAPPTKKP